MSRGSLICAAAIIVVSNALALLHAARNRAGNPEAEITLTNRELQYLSHSDLDDSGVTLHLAWTDPATNAIGFTGPQVENPPYWLDRPKLQALGFDCSVDPSSPDADRFYQRQRPRQAFVALEYNGAAWRTWLEISEREMAKRRAQIQSMYPAEFDLERSRLVPIDASLDPAKLRSLYRDPTTVLILPGVIAVGLHRPAYHGVKLDPERAVQIRGRIQELPSSIHVPRPLSDEFRRVNGPQKGEPQKDLPYRVRLRNGVFFEPWVTGVDFTNVQ